MIWFCINFGWKEHFFHWHLWNCQPSIILGRPEYCHPAPNWHDRLTALLREESGIDGHRWIQLDREPASNLPSCEIAPHIDNWPSHPHSMAHWRPPTPIRKAVRVYHRVWHIQEKLQWIRSYVSSSSKSHPGWPTPPRNLKVWNSNQTKGGFSVLRAFLENKEFVVCLFLPSP